MLAPPLNARGKTENALPATHLAELLLRDTHTEGGQNTFKKTIEVET